MFMFMFMFIILCGLTKSLWARTANCAAGKRGSFSGREDDRSPLFSVEVQDQRSGAIPPFTNTPSCRSGMGGGDNFTLSRPLRGGNFKRNPFKETVVILCLSDRASS